MTTFVLVHGSWHDGGLWQPVREELERLGHDVYTPTMAGHGKGVKKTVSHDDLVQSVVDELDANDLHDVALVGHSFGGTVIARVAEEAPERIARLVFWNAFVPRAGHRAYDEMPPAYRDLFDALAAKSDDNSVMLPFPIWREAFIQDADLETAQRVYELLSPEPYGPFKDVLDLTRFYASTIPRSYVNATEDIAMPPGEWAWHPRMSSRLGMYRLVQLPGSHEVMFTNPELLAAKLVEAGRP